MVSIRDYRPSDLPTVWTMATLPNIGATADPSMPLRLSVAAEPPAAFPALADPGALSGFLVGELDGDLVAMGDCVREVSAEPRWSTSGYTRRRGDKVSVAS